MTGDETSGRRKRLAVIGPSAAALARSRGGFIRDCIAVGHKVLALAPAVGASASEGLLTLGAEVASFQLRPEGFKLFPRRAAIAALGEQLRAWHADGVLAFGAETGPMGIIAARRAKIARRVLLINEIAAGGLTPAQRNAIAAARTVITHNEMDRRAVVAAAKSGTDVRCVTGSGIDLKEITPSPLPEGDNQMIFLCCARLDRSKGVADYLQAASSLTAEGAPARFILAGPDSIGETAIKTEQLSQHAAAVHYAGDRSDLAPLIASAHVVVSPSHREGMPQAVLLGLAQGRPVIATDIPGSRDTVDEMVNGTLVAPGDAADLADGFRRMIRNRALLPAMARASRAKAERGFDRARVTATLLDALGFA